jgi:hypothetical protein
VQQSLNWVLSELQPLGVCRAKIIGGKLMEGPFRHPNAEPSYWNDFPNRTPEFTQSAFAI